MQILRAQGEKGENKKDQGESREREATGYQAKINFPRKFFFRLCWISLAPWSHAHA